MKAPLASLPLPLPLPWLIIKHNPYFKPYTNPNMFRSHSLCRNLLEVQSLLSCSPLRPLSLALTTSLAHHSKISWLFLLVFLDGSSACSLSLGLSNDHSCVGVVIICSISCAHSRSFSSSILFKLRCPCVLHACTLWALCLFVVPMVLLILRINLVLLAPLSLVHVWSLALESAGL